MVILLTILLIVAVLLEGTTTTLPLTLVCLICFTVIKKDTSVFLLAFLAGMFIDVFRVQQIGSTSIFYISLLLLILLYKKKYEIYSVPFVLLATFFSSFFFLMVFGLENFMIQSIIAALVAMGVFAGLRFFIDAKQHKQNGRYEVRVSPRRTYKDW
jgi:cell shape-determining protein MreD